MEALVSSWQVAPDKDLIFLNSVRDVESLLSCVTVA